MSEQIFEGTWEEVTTHADELAGKWVRVIVIEKTSKPELNYAMMKAMRDVAEMQKDMRFTDGSETHRLIREARAGAMYGYEPTE